MAEASGVAFQIKVVNNVILLGRLRMWDDTWRLWERTWRRWERPGRGLFILVTNLPLPQMPKTPCPSSRTWDVSVSMRNKHPEPEPQPWDLNSLRFSEQEAFAMSKTGLIFDAGKYVSLVLSIGKQSSSQQTYLPVCHWYPDFWAVSGDLVQGFRWWALTKQSQLDLTYSRSRSA
jgi:hypothetical protein